MSQLRWLCRRGMKELDVLLERWLERYSDQASSLQTALLVELLDLQDPQLARYLLAGDLHQDLSMAALIAQIRNDP